MYVDSLKVIDGNWILRYIYTHIISYYIYLLTYEVRKVRGSAGAYRWADGQCRNDTRQNQGNLAKTCKDAVAAVAAVA